MHVGEVKLLLALLLENLLVLLAIEVCPALSLAPHPVLVWSHHDRRTDVGATDLVADDIAVDGVVILHRLLQVVKGDGGGALYLPARMEQRVGDFLFIDDHLGQVGFLRLRGVGGKQRRPGWCADDSRRQQQPACDGRKAHRK